MDGLLAVTGSVAQGVRGVLSQSLCLEWLLTFLTSQSNNYEQMQMTKKRDTNKEITGKQQQRTL